MDARRHPSGKPIRKSNRRDWHDGYANRDEPATKRLRRENLTQAIGFLARLNKDEDKHG